MNVAVIGNGAVANLLCWLSHRNKFDYINYVRGKSATQLVCQLIDGNEIVINRNTVNLADVEAKQINQDLVFLPLKAYQILPALEQYSDYFGNNSTLVLLHNGMIDLDDVRKLLPNNPIIAATTNNGAFKPEINTVRITGIGSTQAGWVRRATNAELIEKQLDELIPPCNWSHNIQEILWHKLAINAVINPLTALYKITNGELNRPQYQDEVAAISNEVASIMSKLGYNTNTNQLINKIVQVAASTAANFSSMHQDVAKGRRSEIDNINGYVCSEGARLGIPTPVNQGLVAKITLLESR